jgi:hypothetical protein
LASRRDSTKPDRIELTHREIQALELRTAGLTVAMIAQQLGYADASGAQRAVQRALRATLQVAADEYRALELDRLDALWRIAYGDAASDTSAPLNSRMRAVEQCLGILSRRAKLLGLDAPAKRQVDVISHDLWTQAMEELSAEVAALEQRATAAGIDISDID